MSSLDSDNYSSDFLHYYCDSNKTANSQEIIFYGQNSAMDALIFADQKQKTRSELPFFTRFKTYPTKSVAYESPTRPNYFATFRNQLFKASKNDEFESFNHDSVTKQQIENENLKFVSTASLRERMNQEFAGEDHIFQTNTQQMNGPFVATKSRFSESNLLLPSLILESKPHAQQSMRERERQLLYELRQQQLQNPPQLKAAENKEQPKQTSKSIWERKRQQNVGEIRSFNAKNTEQKSAELRRRHSFHQSQLENNLFGGVCTDNNVDESRSLKEPVSSGESDSSWLDAMARRVRKKAKAKDIWRSMSALRDDSSEHSEGYRQSPNNYYLTHPDTITIHPTAKAQQNRQQQNSRKNVVDTDVVYENESFLTRSISDTAESAESLMRQKVNNIFNNNNDDVRLPLNEVVAAAASTWPLPNRSNFAAVAAVADKIESVVSSAVTSSSTFAVAAHQSEGTTTRLKRSGGGGGNSGANGRILNDVSQRRITKHTKTGSSEKPELDDQTLFISSSSEPSFQASTYHPHNHQSADINQITEYANYLSVFEEEEEEVSNFPFTPAAVKTLNTPQKTKKQSRTGRENNRKTNAAKETPRGEQTFLESTNASTNKATLNGTVFFVSPVGTGDRLLYISEDEWMKAQSPTTTTTTPNWKRSFASVQNQFSVLEQEKSSDSAMAPWFVNRQAPGTCPSSSTSFQGQRIGKSSSSNDIDSPRKRSLNLQSSSAQQQYASNGSAIRGSGPHNRSPSVPPMLINGGVSRFWLEKMRSQQQHADSPVRAYTFSSAPLFSQRQKTANGQQLQQQSLDEQNIVEHFGAAASNSAASGAIEPVSARRENYLREATNRSGVSPLRQKLFQQDAGAAGGGRLSSGQLNDLLDVYGLGGAGKSRTVAGCSLFPTNNLDYFVQLDKQEQCNNNLQNTLLSQTTKTHCENVQKKTVSKNSKAFASSPKNLLQFTQDNDLCFKTSNTIALADQQHQKHQKTVHEKHPQQSAGDPISNVDNISKTSLPHPRPSHNLCEQLVDAAGLQFPFASNGLNVATTNGRRRGGLSLRFFGGLANNPFVVGSAANTQEQPQQQCDQNRHHSKANASTRELPMLSPRSNSSPNFPALEKSLVKELVKERERVHHKPFSLLQFDSLHTSSLPQTLPSSSAEPARRSASKLSPGSSRFRTRPVIQLDNSTKQVFADANCSQQQTHTATVSGGQPAQHFQRQQQLFVDVDGLIGFRQQQPQSPRNTSITWRTTTATDGGGVLPNSAFLHHHHDQQKASTSSGYRQDSTSIPITPSNISRNDINTRSNNELNKPIYDTPQNMHGNQQKPFSNNCYNSYQRHAAIMADPSKQHSQQKPTQIKLFMQQNGTPLIDKHQQKTPKSSEEEDIRQRSILSKQKFVDTENAEVNKLFYEATSIRPSSAAALQTLTKTKAATEAAELVRPWTATRNESKIENDEEAKITAKKTTQKSDADTENSLNNKKFQLEKNKVATKLAHFRNNQEKLCEKQQPKKKFDSESLYGMQAETQADLSLETPKKSSPTTAHHDEAVGDEKFFHIPSFFVETSSEHILESPKNGASATIHATPSEIISGGTGTWKIENQHRIVPPPNYYEILLASQTWPQPSPQQQSAAAVEVTLAAAARKEQPPAGSALEDIATKECSMSPTTNNKIAGKLAGIPRFYHPGGCPRPEVENENALERCRQLFLEKPEKRLNFRDFDEVCRQMKFPVYAKRAVYDACCRFNGLQSLGEDENGGNAEKISTQQATIASNEAAEDKEEPLGQPSIDFNQFFVYWNRMVSRANDDAARFVFTLAAARPPSHHSADFAEFKEQISQRECSTRKRTSSGAKVPALQSSTAPESANEFNYLIKDDFMPMMIDLILSHPGLHFLREAPQFYAKYAEVVIVRIYWNVDRSWSGRITAPMLRRSNFLTVLYQLDEVGDINKVTEYFSYEHFYVTYCKFWELDTDHDMAISKEDMSRHCNGALTDKIIDRIFSTAVVRVPWSDRQKPVESLQFEDFVAFLLAEEDKRHPTSTEYWFRCVDLDGDGRISLYEMQYFYEAIEKKLLAKNMETLQLEDVICNLIDSICPEDGVSVTRRDLKRSGMAHRFFNTFVNTYKYIDQESSDGERATVKLDGDKDMSDWEAFCTVEYELLMGELDCGGEPDDDELEEMGLKQNSHIEVTLESDDELDEEQTRDGGASSTSAVKNFGAAVDECRIVQRVIDLGQHA